MPARKPKRIQRSRARGWRAPAGAIYVGRPTKWGNAFFVFDPRPDRAKLPELREAAAQKYERSLRAGELDVSLDDVRAELRGRDLICWCPLDQACHADVLLRVANGRAGERSRPEAKVSVASSSGPKRARKARRPRPRPSD